MVDSYSFEALDQPAWDVIGGGISAFNAQQAGDDDGRNLCFVIRSAQGEICGGVIAATYWDWLYINLMWIREDLRGHGYGSRLLALAEEEGVKRGARHSHLTPLVFKRWISTANTATRYSGSWITSRQATRVTFYPRICSNLSHSNGD